MAGAECPDDNVLGAFVDERLEAEARSEVSRHLVSCETCRGAVSAAELSSGIAAPHRTNRFEVEEREETLTQVGRFEVMGVIGRGGMGVVYRAHDPALDRDVALKLLRATDDSSDAAEARLEREAKAIARVRHPNVILVHDVGTFEGRVFLAMELVVGETLAGFLVRAERTPREVIAAFVQAGSGLAAAHDAGLVHRDFKPDNVLVGRDGRVLVTDFGLACAPNTSTGSPANANANALLAGSLTFTGALLGTPAYMAPEQHRGDAVGPASDQFSFAVALWEALAGSSPFASIDDRLAGRVAPPRHPSRLPKRVRAALLRALRATPIERHPSMGALLAELSPRKSRWAMPILASVALGSVAIAMTLAVSRGSSVCASADNGLANEWNPARKAATEKALLATGKAYAASAAAEVDRVLDRYAAEWITMRRDACEATNVRHEQSEDLLDRRVQCLDARRAELGSLVGMLGQGGDVVERAAGAVHGLTSLRDCADVTALRAKVALPKDPAARAEARSVEAEIGAAQGERDLGRTAAARKRLDAAVERARKLGYPPTLARTLWLSGIVRAAGADPLSAETQLREAARVADGAGDDATRARAWNELTRLFGYRTERFEAGFEAAEQARAAIARLGGDDELEAKRLDSLAIVLFGAARKSESIEAFRRALAIRERVFGLETTEVGESVNHLGGVLAGTGAASDDEALALLRRSVAIDEKIYGPQHPATVAARIGVARALLLMGKFAEALVEARADVPLAEAAQGPRHPTTAFAISNVGNALDELGRHDEALENHRRSVAILEEAFGAKKREVAQERIAMGVSLTALGRLDEAEVEIEKGTKIFEELWPKKDHPLFVEALLADAELQLARKRSAEALASLERADALAKEEGAATQARVHVDLVRAFAALNRDEDAARLTAAANADLEKAGPVAESSRRALAELNERAPRPDSK